MSVFPEAKGAVSFLSDFINLLFKVLAIMLVLPSMVLWVYLNRLGWGSLFLDSVLSVTGLWGLLLWTSMVLLLVFVSVCVPSWILAMLGRLSASGPTIPPSKFVWAVVFSVIWLWGALIVGGYWWPHLSLVTALLAVVGDLVVIFFCFDSADRRNHKWVKLPSTPVLWFTGAIFFASLCSLVPYVYLRSFFRVVDDFWQIVGWMVCVFLVGLAGYFPGVLAYKGMVGKVVPIKLATNVMLGGGFTAVILFFMLGGLAPKFPWFFLEKLGIYSVESKEFVVVEEKVLPKLQALSDKQNGTNIVRLFPRFSFGEVRLLCKEQYIPYDEFGKTGLFTNNEQVVMARGAEAGKECVAVKRDDVREAH